MGASSHLQLYELERVGVPASRQQVNIKASKAICVPIQTTPSATQAAVCAPIQKTLLSSQVGVVECIHSQPPQLPHFRLGSAETLSSAAAGSTLSRPAIDPVLGTCTTVHPSDAAST